MIECVVRETEQDARLSHTRITDQQELEQVIISLFGHDCLPGLNRRQEVRTGGDGGEDDERGRRGGGGIGRQSDTSR